MPRSRRYSIICYALLDKKAGTRGMNYVTAFGDRPIELEISEINAVLESISPSSGFNECTELMKRMKAPPGGGRSKFCDIEDIGFVCLLRI